MVGLSDCGLVWLEDDLGTISVHVESTQNQNHSREGLQWVRTPLVGGSTLVNTV